MSKSLTITLAVATVAVATTVIFAAALRSPKPDLPVVEKEVITVPEKPEIKPVNLSPATLKLRSDYRSYLWNTAQINGSQIFRIDKTISLYLDNKKRYNVIEKMRTGGVPAAIIFTLHGRESTWNFKRHLHEGSPLTDRTKYVPKNRPKAPPKNGSVYTFEESAEDALYKLKDLESVNWEDREEALFHIEKYNGLGYFKFRDIHSPYLWSGTNHYTRGKYIYDGRFSVSAVDKQLGTCAILKRMSQRGIFIGF